MKSKTWVLAFFLCILAVLLALAGFNWFVDPFGVFGNDPWYSFSETLNPRVAKTAYLQEHWEEYDSYLVGCSSTSSLRAETLNDYLDASFYNTICYGADMRDSLLTVQWLLENCEVRNIVLNIYIDNGLSYNEGEDKLTYKLHEAVSGANPLSFWAGYLLAPPDYAFDKLEARRKDLPMPQTFDVFDEKTGAYDKRVRDVEHIGGLDRYYEAYPVFADYPKASYSLGHINDCVADVAAIRALCEQAGVQLYVLCAPVYGECLDHFSDGDLTRFYTALAGVTDYWDFTYSSVSLEPRYFYDATHFRNDVGDMALARIFGDESVYIPEDFGVYVTAENVAEHLETLTNRALVREDEAYTRDLPVLMYHHLAETDDGSGVLTAAQFEDQIRALSEAGYEAVSPEELYSYVDSGAELPEKPVLITFDDGYESNYELAWPILQQYGMKATIFAIGVSVGKDTYKDTGAAITPHFSFEQAREMIASGVISVQSHTWDLHQSREYDPEPVRATAGILPGESQEDYAEVIRADLETAMRELSAGTGEAVTALAYPEGVYTVLSQALCREAGLKATFTTERFVNTLVKGLPQCLYGMGRIGVGTESGAELVQEIEELKK